MIRFALSILLLVPLLAATPAAAQEWAGLAPNGEGTAPVVRAPNRDLARDRALAACRRVSKTCTDQPALTQDLDDTFALVCCNRPRWACVAAPRRQREAAVAEAQRVLDQHGFSQCKTQAFLSARTGDRFSADENDAPLRDRDRDNRRDRDDRRDRDLRDDRAPDRIDRDNPAPRSDEDRARGPQQD
jgi:hypothetical protein